MLRRLGRFSRREDAEALEVVKSTGYVEGGRKRGKPVNRWFEVLGSDTKVRR